MLFPTFLSENFPNHPHAPSPHLKIWFACFLNGLIKYIRNCKTCANGSNIAKHVWSFDHRLVLIILVSLTTALFPLKKPWGLDTSLPPSMLTITPCSFQTIAVFFSNHSHLIYVRIFFFLPLFFYSFLSCHFCIYSTILMPFWVCYFFAKKYLLFGTSSMLWTVDEPVSERCLYFTPFRLDPL